MNSVIFGIHILRGIKAFAGTSRQTGAMSPTPKKGGRNMRDKLRDALVRVLAEVFYLAGGAFLMLFLAKVGNLTYLGEITAEGSAIIAVLLGILGFLLRSERN